LVFVFNASILQKLEDVDVRKSKTKYIMLFSL